MNKSLSTKKCPRCHRILTIDNFHIQRCQKDGLRCHCKDCTKKSCKIYNDKLRNRKNFKITIKEKRCPCCNEIKPISEFCKQKSNKDGLSTYCKKCNGKRFLKMALTHPNNIRESIVHICPEIANQWCYEKNGNKKPQNYTHLSKEYVWWRCDKDKSHCWLSRINQRTINGRGCPFCTNKKVCDSNSLGTICPDIAAEWHPTQNGKLTAFNVTPGSHKSIWWQCKKNSDHIWKAIPKNRTMNNTGCPFCRSLHSKGETEIAKLLDTKKICYQRQFTISSCRDKYVLPFDFALLNKNDLIGLIEFQGIQHYKPVAFGSGKKDAKQMLKGIKYRDKIKKTFCKQNNISFLEIPYWNFDKIDNIIDNFLFKILK